MQALMHLCAYALLELTEFSSHLPKMHHSVCFLPERHQSACFCALKYHLKSSIAYAIIQVVSINRLNTQHKLKQNCVVSCNTQYVKTLGFNFLPK